LHETNITVSSTFGLPVPQKDYHRTLFVAAALQLAASSNQQRQRSAAVLLIIIMLPIKP
jgi:hypothetical protein